MNKESVLGIAVALIVGILGGFLIFSMSTRKDTPAPVAGVPAGGGSPADYEKRIAEAQKIVARDPKNFEAWVMLGNDYFDTSRPQKAIEAYGKALELNPNSPNILTDQGVMYRQVGWYDKALENFQKAQQIDPKHIQSLYNIGIVYRQDLKQPEKALKPWSRILEIDPASPTAAQVRPTVE
ncbi:MAG TPA: tetratricopeptide repeat protein, partial [Verrucomicrobiae bacterium]|nr:tetratricopeptide repeat protein [Verrucomicrobiae bacterium]